jgi:hypothetical protein
MVPLPSKVRTQKLSTINRTRSNSPSTPLIKACCSKMNPD